MLRGVHNPCSHHAKIDPSEDFRLAFICKASINDPIELIVCRIRPPFTRINYVALSHTWGDLHDIRQIALNHIYRDPREKDGKPGVCFRHSFNVTERLYRALLRLRNHDLTNPFWIDSICINQTDVEERSHQVGLMGNIYSEAAFVGIWLDLPANVGRMVYDMINLLVESLKQQFGDKINGYQLTEEHINFLINNHLCTNGNDDQLLLILNHLLNNPWFRRIWVLQEVYRANANAVLWTFFGLPLLFSNILIALVYYQGHIHGAHRQKHLLQAPNLWYALSQRLTNPSNRLTVRNLPHEQVVLDIIAKRQEGQQPPRKKQMPILGLFSEALVFEATDPRDKLFAILGLGEETNDPTNLPWEVRPDYTKSDSQVYVDFSRYCLKQYQTLAILSVVSKTARLNFVGPDAPIVLPAHIFPPREHPTWALWHAPRAPWTSEVGYYPIYPDHAIAGSSTIDIALLDSDPDPAHLPLRGIYLDEIQTVLPFVFRDHPNNEAFRTDTTPPSLTTCSLHIIWDTLMRDFQFRKVSPEMTDQSLSPYVDDTVLFDNFLLTIICDKQLPSERYGLHLPPADRVRPSQDEELMHRFAAHWFLSHPDIKTKARHAEQIIRSSLLPISVVKLCDKLIPHMLQANEIIKYKRGFEWWLHHTLGRCFFISKRGHIGLCPFGARPGDRLVALWGARLASVLRPKDDDSAIEQSVDGKGWMFVGEAFVQAWMDGRFVTEMSGKGKRPEEIYVLV